VHSSITSHIPRISCVNADSLDISVVVSEGPSVAFVAKSRFWGTCSDVFVYKDTSFVSICPALISSDQIHYNLQYWLGSANSVPEAKAVNKDSLVTSRRSKGNQPTGVPIGCRYPRSRKRPNTSSSQSNHVSKCEQLPRKPFRIA
jgi:hypothetical protein